MSTLNVSSINSGPIGGMRNALINGNPTINQRGYVSGTATTAANQYTLDRWRVVTSGQNISWTDSANVRTVTAPAGGVEQVVEGINLFSGSYVLSWTGTATATVAGSSVANGATVTLVGGVDTTVRFSGGTFALAQLEPGTRSTPFERRSYGAELALAQRYCFAMRSFDSGQAYFRFPAGYTAGLSAAVSNVFFPVEMRSTPSLVSSINWQEIVNNQGNPASGTTVTLVTDGGNRFQMPLVFSNSAGAFSGAGALSAIRVNNSITWSLIFNAEL